MLKSDHKDDDSSLLPLSHEKAQESYHKDDDSRLLPLSQGSNCYFFYFMEADEGRAVSKREKRS